MADVRLTWIGHGTVVVETPDARVIVDPVLRDRIAHLRRRTPLDRSTIGDVDAVLVTHAHHDHLDVASLRTFPTSVPKYAPRGADRVMRRWSIRGVETIEVGGARDVGDLRIEAVRARHSGARLLPRRTAEAVGFMLRPRNGPTLYLAGDTALHAELSDLAPVDVAVLPVGGWWRAPDDSEHLDPEQAIEAAVLLRAQVLVPIHWGTFHPVFLRRFMHPVWSETMRRIEELALEVPSLDVRVLQPGEATVVAPDRHGAAR